MQEVTTASITFPSTSRDALTDILRQGAQAMLSSAIKAEVAQWIGEHEHLRDERGHRQVVRNGYLPERSITTGIGPMKVRQPRVHDRRKDEEAEPNGTVAGCSARRMSWGETKVLCRIRFARDWY